MTSQEGCSVTEGHTQPVVKRFLYYITCYITKICCIACYKGLDSFLMIGHVIQIKKPLTLYDLRYKLCYI